MTTLFFGITFLGPFRVATGSARAGVDATFSSRQPLPASSLKGRMRAEAEAVVRHDNPLIVQIFGGPGKPSRWAWSDAAFAEPPSCRPRGRVRIDSDSKTAIRGALQIGDDAWADKASFDVEFTGATGEAPADDILVLTAAAHSITALGGERRRGLGWVEVRSDRQWTLSDTRRLLQIRNGHAAD